MNYKINGKNYKVENVCCEGLIINVNGTTITNNNKQTMELLRSDSYMVYVEGDELGFDTFEEAYEYATTKQKDTCRL